MSDIQSVQTVVDLQPEGFSPEQQLIDAARTVLRAKALVANRTAARSSTRMEPSRANVELAHAEDALQSAYERFAGVLEPHTGVSAHTLMARGDALGAFDAYIELNLAIVSPYVVQADGGMGCVNIH